MASIELTEFAGLVTAPGLLARNPASCVEAINWEFPAPGVIRKRRGQERLPGNTGGPVYQVLTSRLLGNQVLAHVGTTAQATQLRVGDGTAALTALSSIDGSNVTRGTNIRTRGAVSQRNHYVTADEGVRRVESALTTVRYAGMPRGLGISTRGGAATAFLLLAGGPFAVDYARAYRVTWHRKDDDGTELGGPPTARFVLTNRLNTLGGGGVGQSYLRLSFDIPVEFGSLSTALATSYYWRLWGTRTYADAAGELGDDEMFLIAEKYLTAGDIAAGFVQYDDATPDAFLLASPRLHTNLYNFPPIEAGLRQGVANADEAPPIANDVAYWQDCMWYADIEWRPRVSASLISNFADGDTVTLSGDFGALTLTARNVPAAANDFQIVTTAPTTLINIRETVLQMVALINRRSTALSLGLTACQTFTSATLPGLFYVECNRPQGADFIFDSSAPTRFQFLDGATAGEPSPSTALTNGLAFSKPLRADAVPPVNVLTAGPADARVLRVFPFRDRLLVFSDYGIYQVTGRTFADFSVNPFDLGYRLLGRELVALCDEKVYAWCYEGIIEIDDGGVKVVSQPIEPTIEQAFVSLATSPQAAYPIVAKLGFATAYRNQHQVRFHYPIEDSVEVFGCSNWLAFDTRTRAWAVGALTKQIANDHYDNRSCAVVRFGDDRICYGNWNFGGGDTRLFLERRAYASSDYTDDNNDGLSALPIESTLAFQYQVPDAKGAQHWQQLAINWDGLETSWQALPTSIFVNFQSESDSASSTYAVAARVTRVEPAVRRAQRFRVVLIHSLAEYCGIVGVTQEYRDRGSRFARQVTP